MWTKTTVTAYNGNNESVTDTRWNYNTAAMEGWNGAEPGDGPAVPAVPVGAGAGPCSLRIRQGG